MATLSLLACCGLAWMAVRRGWSPRPAIGKWVAPVLALLIGGVWTALLVPAWPGALLAAAGLSALVRVWPIRRRDATVEVAFSNRALDTTVYRPQS